MKKKDKIEGAWATVIRELGYPKLNPHLVDSPARVARFLRDWHTQGKDPPKLTCFPNEPRVDEVVLVGGIRFYSMCAHHGLPFVGEAAIGYIPDEKVLGLSKFARVVQHFASRFQTQEVLTEQVASYLDTSLMPTGIGVVLRAEHFCMSMRGVRAHGHYTTTSAMRGAFFKQPGARAEILNLIRSTP